MTIHTLTTPALVKATKVKANKRTNAHDIRSTSEMNVVNIRSARKAQEKAKQELLDYMLWTMRLDMDPHNIYEDPIAAYREEIKATLSVA